MSAWALRQPLVEVPSNNRRQPAAFSCAVRVLSAEAAPVATGRTVVEDGHLTTADEETIARELAAVSRRIQEVAV